MNTIKIFLAVLVICYLFNTLFLNNKNIIENMDNKWLRNENCKWKMSKTVNEVLNEYNINKGDLTEWNLFLPCSYNNAYKQLLGIPPAKLGKKLFIINNCDALTSKNNLWNLIKNKYGLHKAKFLMPNTYTLINTPSNKSEISRFLKEYSLNKIYILKKNIQRQKGLKITNKKNDIVNGNNKGYVIAQELLQNPYLIDNRKINIRVYLLIVCKNNIVNSYAHRNGFVYYTKVPYKNNSLSHDHNITTGYIDRSVYEKNPLTLEDLRIYLDNPIRKLSNIEYNIVSQGNRISDVLFKNIYKLIGLVVDATRNSICNTPGTPQHIRDQTSFQLFGVDIAIGKNFELNVMEINKGPDLGAKDKRDKQVKKSVVVDMFKVIGLIDNKPIHNFYKLN